MNNSPKFLGIIMLIASILILICVNNDHKYAAVGLLVPTMFLAGLYIIRGNYWWRAIFISYSAISTVSYCVILALLNESQVAFDLNEGGIRVGLCLLLNLIFWIGGFVIRKATEPKLQIIR